MCARNEEKLTHKVFARVSKTKYDELQQILLQSRCRTLGELIRDILTDKKIVTVTHDASLDKVMTELSGIRSQLQAIGRNINQVTRRLHQERLPAAQRELLLSLAELQQQTEQSVSGLFTAVAKLSERWLPE
ncbi:plasmid mobilization relaxosome protein MobC [Chitinophaga barathri]|nr:plasmid mobilization relaxosome protein MobC [Chitinophaga barathri]